MNAWTPCPFAADYRFDADAVRAQWADLHRADGEPLPNDAALQAGWALLHGGRFEIADLGDHLFVSGEVISSRRGELSVMVSEWRIAAKALAPLPNMYAELNEETRVRQRYLDLIQREQARTNVVTRARTMASLRR